MSNNVRSSLSSEEKELLLKMLGPKCQAQVSALAQIYGTDPSNHKEWTKRFCGLITFTKDHSRRSFFIQCYDMDTKQKVFEQELYNNFSYQVSTPFFHQFEADNQMIGINFADEGEAESFGYVIKQRIRKQKNREARQRRQQELSQSTYQGFQQPPSLSVSIPSSNKGKKSNQISKDEISPPMNFQHITHVGFDEGFSSFNEGKDLDHFFEKAGVTRKFLQHNQMRKFIYKFIDENGGIEKAAEENKLYRSLKEIQETPKDKAIFDRNQVKHKKSGASPRPLPRLSIVKSSIPEPPPLPPPPAPPQPVTMTTDLSQNPDARSDLFAQIRQRPLLKHIDQTDQEKPDDSRSNIMNKLKNKIGNQEFQLKPVTKDDSENSPFSIAATLAQELKSRVKVFLGDSESEEDADDEEWEET